MNPWMIYGANGYTGRLAAEEAKRRGWNPIIAGRNRGVIEELGRSLGLETRVFDLGNADEVAKNLQGIAVVLNCAGPFSSTCQRMLAGCVKSKTHYLDITGEISVFEYTHNNGEQWKKAGIVVMPGVGFDVVPSDCLAAMLKRALPDATHLRMAFKSRFGKLSPGTTKTMIEGVPEGGKIRQEGKIVAVSSTYKIEKIPFVEGAEPESAVTIPWGDVSTAYYSTGIPNIEIFMGASPRRIKGMQVPGLVKMMMGLKPVQKFIQWRIGKTVKGPTSEERAKDRMFLWGEVTNPAGIRVTMRMRTPEGYTLTVDSSLTAAAKLLESNLAPGAYTPSMAFGADFVLSLMGVEVKPEE